MYYRNSAVEYLLGDYMLTYKSIASIMLLLAAGLMSPAVGVVRAQETKPKEAVVVDLALLIPEIEKFLDDSIAKFRRENPDAVVSMLVLGSASYERYLSLHADTQANSDTKVQKSPDFQGKDAHGQFNDNPADAKYELGYLNLKKLPVWYDLKVPLSFKYPDGKVVPVDLKRGDAPIHEAMLKFLVPIVENHKGYQSLKRERIFRLGVSTSDESYMKFWKTKE